MGRPSQPADSRIHLLSTTGGIAPRTESYGNSSIASPPIWRRLRRRWTPMSIVRQLGRVIMLCDLPIQAVRLLNHLNQPSLPCAPVLSQYILASMDARQGHYPRQPRAGRRRRKPTNWRPGTWMAGAVLRQFVLNGTSVPRHPLARAVFAGGPKSAAGCSSSHALRCPSPRELPKRARRPLRGWRSLLLFPGQRRIGPACFWY